MSRLSVESRCVCNAAAIAIFLLGCSDGFAPLPAGRAVLVTSGEAPELTVVDGSSGAVATRIPLGSATETAAISGDGSTLFIAEGRAGPGDPIALNTRNLSVQRTEAQSTIQNVRADRWGGIGVAAHTAIASSPDESRLHLAPAFVQDLAVSPDGARVYITAGTGSGVLDGPSQTGHLIAVDPVARTGLWSKALGVWAPRQLFVR